MRSVGPLIALAIVIVTIGIVMLATRAAPTLSNGCAYSERGIPQCGVYVGAAIGGNDDPDERERQLGQKLGLRRTYWTTQRVDKAIAAARTDLAAGRLPWLSFKLEVSWEAAATGAMDDWARDFARRVSQLPGPVWVALHHEPEGDGDILAWRAMQERLGPLLRDGAPNLGFTVIVTGWNQFNRPDEFSLERIWPNTVVDVAGFDIYNFYGARRGPVSVTQVSDLGSEYFTPISKWAAERDMAWALAETGITDTAAIDHPELLSRTLESLKESGGIALTYFDSHLNSTAPWHLDDPDKRAQFAALLADAPRLPEVR